MMSSYTVESWKQQSKYMIMVPYAQVVNMQSGVNVSNRNSDQQREMYLKNSCVALVSAKKYNPEADVALVTNIEVPQVYRTVLEQNGVVVIHIGFDKFCFGENYTWGLAFYKLCAQYHIAHNTEYEAILCLDGDTYTQSSYHPVWEAARSCAVCYRIGSNKTNAGTSKIYEEAEAFRGTDAEFFHYGGEFFAASYEMMRKITEKEEAVFDKMMETGFRVKTGDEFISSMVVNEMQDEIRTANDYVFRFWTGSYRSISPAYKTTILCLHVPAEKGTGMIRLYDRYISGGSLPEREKVWRILHITHRSLMETAKMIVKKIVKH